jgi:hypothetical protein
MPIKKSDFGEKSDFSNRAQGAQEIFGKNRISFEIQWSGNFRFRVLVQEGENSKTIQQVAWAHGPKLKSLKKTTQDSDKKISRL